ncbi:hypothetical protein HAX54_013593 [Datura stramonium]|uniref:LysM domain-containing protein n=1 Tax=Datura stramonium TaxID=4076 RepID=A0ABS8TN83_DATST|nr:hypothetical protein [Datura stramonium]
MVKASNNCYFNVALLVFITFLLILTTPSLGGRILISNNGTSSQAIPTCTAVYNVDTGIICDNIIKSFDLKAEDFSSLNPNLNCDDLFVGEYLCLNGTLSA